MNSAPLPALENLDCSALIDAAARVARGVPQWKLGGAYAFKVPQAHEKVSTTVRTALGLHDDYWVARVTEFRELDPEGRRRAFDQLMQFSIGSTTDLDASHTEYEHKYIEELYHSRTEARAITGAPADYECFSYVAELHYRLQWPLARRRFCNLVLIARHRSRNSAYVISLAVKPDVVGATSAGFVDAQYTAVEHVEYDSEADQLRWTMATCSDAKGNVPLWLAKLSMNSVVAKDVSHFLNWVAEKN